MTVTCLILIIIAAICAAVSEFAARTTAPLIALCALAIGLAAPDSEVTWQSVAFWGACAAVALGINMMLPPQVSRNRSGQAYLFGAALAGAFTVMIISTAGMILGAAAGALCGAIAFSRTPAGTSLRFPSSQFLNYVCAKGLPAIVTACLCGLAVLSAAALIHSL